MVNLARQALNALLLVILLTLLTGVAYPLVTTGLAQVFFPRQANGSLVRDKQGVVTGSSLIGQDFSGAQYFHPRPSAAGSNGYDGSASGGSNLGPTNTKLIESVRERAVAYREENGLAPDTPVPVDAVTASASGLDPEISPANALLQVPRVARVRGLPEDEVRRLVSRFTRGRNLEIIGEPRVNVLQLNTALDQTAH